MKTFLLAVLFTLPLLASEDESRREKALATLQSSYGEATTVVLSDVTFTKDTFVLTIQEVWKGAGRFKVGDQVTIPRGQPPGGLPPPVGKEEEERGRALVFFYSRTAQSGQRMTFFTGDKLRMSPDVTVETLRLKLAPTPKKSPAPDRSAARP